MRLLDVLRGLLPARPEPEPSPVSARGTKVEDRSKDVIDEALQASNAWWAEVRRADAILHPQPPSSPRKPRARAASH